MGLVLFVDPRTIDETVDRIAAAVRPAAVVGAKGFRQLFGWAEAAGVLIPGSNAFIQALAAEEEGKYLGKDREFDRFCAGSVNIMGKARYGFYIGAVGVIADLYSFLR